MKKYQTYVKCKICSKEIFEGNFNKHLEKHFNPSSRLCNKWYKKYFHLDSNVLVCSICDEEIHPELKTSKLEYEQHLEKHNIRE